MGPVAASCHLSLHACNWSLFARRLSIDSRAYVISQHAHWPIRTPDWSSCLGGQRRILVTQPRGTPEHERHLLISFRRLYCPLYIFPPHLFVFGYRAILIWGDRDMAGGCSHTKPLLTGLFLMEPNNFPYNLFLSGFFNYFSFCWQIKFTMKPNLSRLLERLLRTI